jgi:hypothetical protein
LGHSKGDFPGSTIVTTFGDSSWSSPLAKPRTKNATNAEPGVVVGR